MSEPLSARAVAFYLPQFHPIPENDAWWGPGFTEWTNAARARRLFPGHRQPHLPADLGFYDLRSPESRQAQSDLAQAHGIEAFIYWHYWFGAAERILERPFAEVLGSGAPSQKFALAWANQTWSGIWHGAADRVLREQRYLGPDDDQRHFDSILPAFRDDRYLRVGDRPVFYVFRPEQLPSAREFVDRWQAMARAAGLPGLYLVAEESDLLGRGARFLEAEAVGFDAGVYMRLPTADSPGQHLRMRLGRKAMGGGPEIYPYAREPIPVPAEFDTAFHQPSVYPNWDNTPRSGRGGLVLHGSSPDRFRVHLRAAIDRAQRAPVDERFVWIKSWNEWAEGNYLEPDQEYGRGWLEVVRGEVTAPPPASPPSGGPLRIAMISYYLPSGSKIGVGYQAHEMANGLADRGHDVTVFSNCPPVDGARYRHEHVDPQGSLRTFRFATQLARRDFSGYDVVHAWGDDYWIWRRRGRAHVRTLPGSCFEEAIHIRGFKERLRMFVLGLTELLGTMVADTCVVISPATRRWWPWVRTIIPCGTSITGPVGVERDPATILMVGTWGNRKRGSLLAAEFVEHVLPRVPEAQLRIVASDVPTDFHPAVRGLGRLDDDQLRAEYARATIFCLPSSYEGFGIPYAEAMATGTPVVATANVGAKYVTRNGADGLLVGDSELGERLADLLEDAPRRAELSRRGLQRAATFSMDSVLTQYEAVFRSTIDRREQRKRTRG